LAPGHWVFHASGSGPAFVTLGAHPVATERLVAVLEHIITCLGLGKQTVV
jgi:hypothetical protein